MCRTVGELKSLIKDLPDDLPVVGCDGRDWPDYRQVSFYMDDRTQDDPVGWQERKQRPELIEWWGGKEPPDVVLVCNTD